ncbi:YczI family protein [Solibacillus sp. CAU 1738]|uniref:YczI family protein n=1 Tax=Solibacillus sp. CAU 1738 TaxID=3140363 RepID=UPI0032611FA9
MLKVMRIIFTVIGAGLGVYALITDKFQVMPLMLFSLGAMMLLTGISELKEKRMTMAIISFLSAAFALFVCVYTFNTWVQ